ncbi:prolyl-tRNA editing enzyme YbaK/EbsC (Cys-tRNA(Pro) deacylase) [Rhodothalassium salexigens DSM 2132]|uniref:Prolyl-tRNA editing enzyme YbaK/EbsC (Cys-tRNA(Pro) deacylase) n=1 Tax=Rhodothalassium salexigens DSM 2132 TaxID=1188247 RepID=A0A4R2PKH5_RHOSA|nr:YbaK/EbsC family protein [Rhodothalassium salexigens]MBB4211563.1 prolyl-tRNA editing enzyme YbaK/EbsC (Cys-tRNA(Pro) deacylase) [Rhodothalassium salexigens DSM 2132]MBK1638417.1 hypothetical protein [Rhodothalassium salexigens DSM 2132]TCP34505.1 prolyl-tRNA editing enzyme YbaK/EbsC (Cys-tRNA(Pro) deacylase) [Rhodothalassium salexigens DSM 2132]
MSKSVKRVEQAAERAGLEIAIVRMPGSTRTAGEAAAACGCLVAQIAKSMIFEGRVSGALKLLLVSGAHQVALDQTETLFGEPLARADAKRVRSETGFAIGGVAPIGHLAPIDTWMDRRLLAHDTIWVAAGAPDAVFAVRPDTLRRVIDARLFDAPVDG